MVVRNCLSIQVIFVMIRGIIRGHLSDVITLTDVISYKS